MRTHERKGLGASLGKQFVAYHERYGAFSPLSIPEERLHSWNKVKDRVIENIKNPDLPHLKGELFEFEPFTFLGVEEGLANQKPTFVASPFYIPNAFYPVVLIDFMFFNYTNTHFVILPADRLPLERLKVFRFQVGLLKGGREYFWEVDFAKYDSSFWDTQESHVMRNIGYHDKKGAYCVGLENSLKALNEARLYTVAVMGQKDENQSALHYWRRMELEAKCICSASPLNREGFESEKETILDLPKTLPLGDAALMFETLNKWFKENPADGLKRSFDLINILRGKNAALLTIQTLSLQRLVLFLSPYMDEGLRMPSLSLNEGVGIDYVELDGDALSGKFSEFWEEVRLGNCWYYEKVIGLGNIHVSKDVFNANCPKLEDENIPEAVQFIKDQLEEATRLKEWNLPFGGLFQLIGPISAVKTYEINNDVYLVFCFQNGRYFQLIINPGTQTYAISPDNFEIAFRGADGILTEATGKIEDIKDRHLLALLQIGGAIIRDAWVVEERETIFGEGRATRKISPLLGDRRKQIVVYVPRIRYIKKYEDIKRAREELNYAVRRQHWVKGHLRKAVKASPAQILIAQRHGVYIPEGKTYVQGHNRGQLAAERIYRSRSALRCLRALDAPGLGIDGWFSFEKNVKQWLESFGYEADHKAASRNGDGGIDIQASKGTEHLYVQCKYWKDPVGINVVREMIGTLITYPEGSLGVIVTSSELTIPARELAIQNGIQFVENVSFEKPIDKDLKKRA